MFSIPHLHFVHLCLTVTVASSVTVCDLLMFWPSSAHLCLYFWTSVKGFVSSRNCCVSAETFQATSSHETATHQHNMEAGWSRRNLNDRRKKNVFFGMRMWNGQQLYRNIQFFLHEQLKNSKQSRSCSWRLFTGNAPVNPLGMSPLCHTEDGVGVGILENICKLSTSAVNARFEGKTI